MGKFPLDLERLQQVLDYLNDGVYLTDRSRRILLWNRRAEEITGWKASDVVGRRCRDGLLEHLDTHGHALCRSDLCPLARAMRTRSGSKEPVLVYARGADSRRIPVSTSVAPLWDEAGRVVGGIEVFRDESARMQDLEFARRVQQHVLPERLPASETIGFEVGYYPHDLVGGDFYWVRELRPNVFASLVADVRGHGVSAALYTMVLSSYLSGAGSMLEEPGRLMGALNEHLEALTVADSFASAVYLVLDGKERTLRYSNAGHPPPLLLDARTEEVQELGAHGLFLGVLIPQEYEETRMDLPEQGALLCYSDGAIEVRGRDGTEFGQARLEAYLRAESGRRGFPARFYRHLTRMSAAVSLPDDLLLLLARLQRSARAGRPRRRRASGGA
jgi:sigma-B regulation protein RsbU (phosphoserine phosphatase)